MLLCCSAALDGTCEAAHSPTRHVQAQAINKSLSSLSNVITALGNKQRHVPFRDSKLTFLLQECLGGDSKCLMLVNVSPAAVHHGETLCSLRFAQKVNSCEVSNPKGKASRPSLGASASM